MSRNRKQKRRKNKKITTVQTYRPKTEDERQFWELVKQIVISTRPSAGKISLIDVIDACLFTGYYILQENCKEHSREDNARFYMELANDTLTMDTRLTNKPIMIHHEDRNKPNIEGMFQ